MANERVNTRWILDTAEAVVVSGIFLKIQAIHFVGTTDADVCLLSDAAGKKIWSAKLGTVATAGYNATLELGDEGMTVNGLTLTTLTHGTAYIYLGKL